MLESIERTETPMPLAYTVEQELIIPDRAYNGDDVAVVMISGARYGGAWKLNALIGDPDVPEVIGSIFTGEGDRPSMVVDTALVWFNDACRRAGVKMAHFEDKSAGYGPAEAPYFVTVLALADRR